MCLEIMAWEVFQWSGRKVINKVRKALEIILMNLKEVRPNPWGQVYRLRNGLGVWGCHLLCGL